MEIRERHRGRLIDHIGLVVRDMAASKAFYSAIFGVLKIPIGGSDNRNFWADELFLATLDSEDVQGEPTGRHHIAFQAQDRTMVDAFHQAALAHGGRDNGAPGERSYHPGYYAAFVLDPDGNNIEAVFHGESERSADSVQIKYRIASAA
jgi:catechol 2,3-dioxygenase-like lactoylglutathione lyase family enzyme